MIKKLKTPVLDGLHEDCLDPKCSHLVSFAPDSAIEGVPVDGVIGGFTFSNGSKSLIYQCATCLGLFKFHENWARHKEEKHSLLYSPITGYADGSPKWRELDIKESDVFAYPEIKNRDDLI